MSTYARRFSASFGAAHTGQAANLSATLKSTADATLATLTGIAEEPAGSGCYWGTCAAFDPTWSGSIVWTIAGGPSAVEDFGTTQGPHVLDGQLVWAAGGTPSTQPAVYATQALGLASATVMADPKGETGSSTSLTLNHPYNEATVLLTFTVDTYGNRSGMTINNLPS